MMKKEIQEGEELSDTQSVSVRIPIEDLNWLREISDGPLASEIKKAIKFYIDAWIRQGFVSFLNFGGETHTFVKVDVVAKAMNISPQAVRKKCRLGQIRAIKPARDWLIFASELPSLFMPNISHISQDIEKIKKTEV